MDNSTLKDCPNYHDGLMYINFYDKERSDNFGPAILDTLRGKIIVLKGLDGKNQFSLDPGGVRVELLCIITDPYDTTQKIVYLKNCKGCASGILRYKFGILNNLIEGPVEPAIINNKKEALHDSNHLGESYVKR